MLDFMSAGAIVFTAILMIVVGELLDWWTDPPE